MEYVHCRWGRRPSIVFTLPFSYLLHKGYNIIFSTVIIGDDTTCQLFQSMLMISTDLFIYFLYQLSLYCFFSSTLNLECCLLQEPSSESSQPRVSPYSLAGNDAVCYYNWFWSFNGLFSCLETNENLASVLIFQSPACNNFPKNYFISQLHATIISSGCNRATQGPT